MRVRPIYCLCEETIVNDISIKDIMTTDVFTVPRDWSLDQLADFLVANNITGAPVISESGDVVGVVSMTDVVRYRSMPLIYSSAHDTHEYYLSSMGRQYSDEEIDAFRLEEGERATVADVMTPVIFSVSEDASVREAAEIMTTGNVHRLLVLKDQQVIGIVAALDIVRVVRDL